MGIFVGECSLRDLGQNLKVSHLLAKNLETKIIEGTVILPVWYGYGTLREEWRGGGVRQRVAGEPVCNSEEVTGVWGKFA